MNKTEIVAWLKANRNERGIENWNKLGAANRGLESYGLGLTQLRKLAKQVGRDHALSQELWKSDVYDLKTIALLIDEPKLMTQEAAEEQVDQLHAGLLSHVFSSCDAALAKTSFAAELAQRWVQSSDSIRKSCGYGLVYELSKSKKKSAPDEAYFLGHVERIAASIKAEPGPVQGSMGAALMGIGKRSPALNRAALKVARAIGPIDFAAEGSSCEPFDVVKHLTSDYLKAKFGK